MLHLAVRYADPRSMPKRGGIRLTLALAALLVFVVLPQTVAFLLEWLWFGAIGYRSVYLTGLRAQASLGTFVVAAAFAVLSGTCGWRFRPSPARTSCSPAAPAAGTVQPAIIQREHLFRITGLACLAVSVLMGLVAGSEWLSWLQFWHHVPFGIVDPILGHDIGFYIFRLPMLEFGEQLLMTLLIFSFIGSAVAYVLAGTLNYSRRGGVSVASKARVHLSLLAAAFFLALAYHAYLDIPHLLTTLGGAGTVHGASYTDVMARLPALRVLVAGVVRGGGAGGLQRIFASAVAAACGAGALLDHRLRRRDLRCRPFNASSSPRTSKRRKRRTCCTTSRARGARSTWAPYSPGALWRCRAHPGRYRRQRRHHQECPPVGSPAAAGHLRANPGTAHLLRLRLRGQRSLHDQRRAPASHVVGARAEQCEPPQQDLDQ
jgi:hypothetical protein